MKVSDLIEELETGDRSMEHLKTEGSEPMSPQALSNSGLADVFRKLAAAGSGLGGGLAGSSLGLAQQQMNQFQNYANQQNMQGGSSWNR